MWVYELSEGWIFCHYRASVGTYKQECNTKGCMKRAIRYRCYSLRYGYEGMRYLVVRDKTHIGFRFTNHWKFQNFLTKQRYSIFFPRKSSFLCTFRGKSFEWMKSPFFPGARKKNSFEIEWMNGQRTFPRAKKKNRKIFGNFLEKTKNLPVFFFSAFSEKKKNTIFGFEWMNGQRTFPCKKNMK